jgi:hypothetical protein
MGAQPKVHMTVEEYLAWVGQQPGRHELFDGNVIAMSRKALHMPSGRPLSTGDTILTRIVTEGVIMLDPPGFEIAVSDVYSD